MSGFGIGFMGRIDNSNKTENIISIIQVTEEFNQHLSQKELSIITFTVCVCVLHYILQVNGIHFLYM